MEPALVPSPQAHPSKRGGLYALLMARAAGLPNDDLFARMLLSQTSAQSALPAGLGLTAGDFRTLMARHFPGFRLPAPLA
ncbi:MAG: nitrogen fixation protein NifQ, partial [Gammaproteobacteria bacterium]|nr:nitrogen fixation protein NifQ [Gammaproteobacteria bacterium]